MTGRVTAVILVASASAIVLTPTTSNAVVTAETWVSYNAGSPPLSSYWGVPYNNPTAATGLPTARQSVESVPDGDGGFTVFADDSVITPFNAPYNPEHVVGINAGGSLTLELSEAVAGNGALIVHSAVGLGFNFSTGTATGVTYTDDRVARVRVADTLGEWRDLGLIVFDDATNYYADASDPFASDDGAQVADFTKKFDQTPADFAGKSFEQTLAIYDGSAGGTWIDLGPSGLSDVLYVEFSLASDSPYLMYVDSVVAVPEPTTLAVLAIVPVLLGRRRSAR